MKLSLIVAAAENNCIGINNNLPWYLPEDLKYFKQVTMGKPIIMGRKTWESIGRPLPGRTNIVITRNENYPEPEGVRVVRTLDAAMELAEAVAEIDGAEELMVIGGAGIYELCLPKADRLYFTRVHAEVEGDAFFPEVDWNQWKLLGEEHHKAEGGHGEDANRYDYTFCVYDRK
jgi:dihydrofolate reductase